MTSILSGSLAEQLTDALLDADIPQSCVLTTQTVGGEPDEPTIVDAPHACSGWVDTYDTAERANGDVLVNDRKVYILANSLDVTPAPGNTVTVDGATFSIITVAIDPAGAAWVLQVRV